MSNLQSGTILQGGKYRIEKALGQGGFGITYLAEQTLMEREVCIKEFFMKEYCDRDEATSQVSLGTTNNKAMMEKYQEKFLKEARMIARLDHPNIIRIHDVFMENNTAYYVMEYIEGKNLNELVKERGALPEAVAVEYIKQIGEGLAYVHERSINHLDIKPGNILIRKSDNRPILIDFGMSKQYDESGDQTSSTPLGISTGYAPLELYQVGGVSSFSPQTDIYELGATLFRLVTGEVPPSVSDVLNEGLPELSISISASTRSAIEKAMGVKKKDRPESMSSFVAMLFVPTDSADKQKGEAKLEIVTNTSANDEDATILVEDVETHRSVNKGAEVVDAQMKINPIESPAFFSKPHLAFYQSSLTMVDRIVRLNRYIDNQDFGDDFFGLLHSTQEIDPTNASLFYLEGYVYYLRDDPEEAAKYYKKVLSLNPNYIMGLIGLGAIYYDNAVELQTNASDEDDSDKFFSVMKDIDDNLEKAIIPLEKVFANADDANLKSIAARYLKSIYHHLRTKNPKYEALFKKYESFSIQ